MVAQSVGSSLGNPFGTDKKNKSDIEKKSIRTDPLVGQVTEKFTAFPTTLVFTSQDRTITLGKGFLHSFSHSWGHIGPTVDGAFFASFLLE